MMMQSQLLIGGIKVEDTPAFRSALQDAYQLVHKEYEDKVAALERERETIEEDKAQVDRYKQLLLKQRDIMIALTARLNERDETILALQEELDAYDRQQRMLEDALDQKTAALIHLQRVAMEFHANSPMKNAQLAHALGLSSSQQHGGNMSANGSANNSFEGDIVPHHHGHHGGNHHGHHGHRSHHLSDGEGHGHGQNNNNGGGRPGSSLDYLLAKKEAEEERDTVKAELARERMLVEQLRDRTLGHEKEKAALRTILEAKMKSLVDSIARGMTSGETAVSDNMLREVSALQKLVNASIAALKQADVRTSSSGSANNGTHNNNGNNNIVMVNNNNNYSSGSNGQYASSGSTRSNSTGPSRSNSFQASGSN
jgi:kinesin family protein 3/17